MNPTFDAEVVAGRLKTARRLAGLSQEDAARQLDVSQKTIARWEHGETTGYLGALERIAAIYGTTPEAILGDDGDSGQVASQLAALREELDELRGMMLDPKRLRAAADALIEEERPRRRKRA